MSLDLAVVPVPSWPFWPWLRGSRTAPHPGPQAPSLQPVAILPKSKSAEAGIEGPALSVRPHTEAALVGSLGTEGCAPVALCAGAGRPAVRGEARHSASCARGTRAAVQALVCMDWKGSRELSGEGEAFVPGGKRVCGSRALQRQAVRVGQGQVGSFRRGRQKRMGLLLEKAACQRLDAFLPRPPQSSGRRCALCSGTAGLCVGTLCGASRRGGCSSHRSVPTRSASRV